MCMRQRVCGLNETEIGRLNYVFLSTEKRTGPNQKGDLHRVRKNKRNN